MTLFCGLCIGGPEPEGKGNPGEIEFQRARPAGAMGTRAAADAIATGRDGALPARIDGRNTVSLGRSAGAWFRGLQCGDIPQERASAELRSRAWSGQEAAPDVAVKRSA